MSHNTESPVKTYLSEDELKMMRHIRILIPRKKYVYESTLVSYLVIPNHEAKKVVRSLQLKGLIKKAGPTGRTAWMPV